MALAKRVLYDDDADDGVAVKQVEHILDFVSMMNCGSILAAIKQTTLPTYEIGDELPEICQELRDMINDVQKQSNKATSLEAKTIPMALKLAPGCWVQLNNDDKKLVSCQLQEAYGPANIALSESELLPEFKTWPTSPMPSA